MREAIARLEQAHGPTPVKIGAQKYLEDFYANVDWAAVARRMG